MAGAVSFLQVATDTTDASTYTFSAQNLGTEAGDRYIIVAVHARDSGTGAITVDSVTVGGVTASIVVQRQAIGSSNSVLAAMAIAAVPTGTSGDIVVTLSTTVLRCGIGAFRAVGIDGTAHDSDSSILTDPSVALDIPAEGIAVGAATAAINNDTATWTGLTERYDQEMEALTPMSGASDNFATQQTGLTITCDWATGDVDEDAGVFASWGPAAAGGQPTMRRFGAVSHAAKISRGPGVSFFSRGGLLRPATARGLVSAAPMRKAA